MYTMGLRPIASRIPQEMDEELREIMEYEKVDKATAVRKIMEIGISEWRKSFAIQLLQHGKASFNKAAEIGKLSVWEFADLLREKRVEWVESGTAQSD